MYAQHRSINKHCLLLVLLALCSLAIAVDFNIKISQTALAEGFVIAYGYAKYDQIPAELYSNNEMFAALAQDAYNQAITACTNTVLDNGDKIGKGRCPETMTALLVDDELFLGSSISIAPYWSDNLQNQALSRLWQTIPSPGHNGIGSAQAAVAQLYTQCKAAIGRPDLVDGFCGEVTALTQYYAKHNIMPNSDAAFTNPTDPGLLSFRNPDQGNHIRQALAITWSGGGKKVLSPCNQEQRDSRKPEKRSLACENVLRFISLQGVINDNNQALKEPLASTTYLAPEFVDPNPADFCFAPPQA